jgi:chitinase
VRKHKLVGYWHNFDNGSGFVRLRDVSSDYDQINVAFAEPIDNATSGNIGFTPFGTTVDEFKADVQFQKSRGLKVVISIGGQNGIVSLETAAAAQKFTQTMIAIIEQYGFNGIDIDFEGSSIRMNSNDLDFRNPTTPLIVNTIQAINNIYNHFGSGFVLTFAPETFFVQMGYNRYGGAGGAYLPIIHALRDKLTYLHVQQYNSGPIMGLDNVWYTMPDPNFHVAMADMVLFGIPLNAGANGVFPPLPPEKVLIGLPANVNAGNGFTSVTDVHKVLNYLARGQSFGGSYVLRTPGGYPAFGGLMTWSINWDKFNNFEFSRQHRQFLDTLP